MISTMFLFGIGRGAVRRAGTAALVMAALGTLALAQDAGTAAKPSSSPAPQSQPGKSPAKKKPAPKPSLNELLRLLAEQRSLIEQQQRLIAEQQMRLAEQEDKLQTQGAAIEEQTARVAALEGQLAAVNQQLSTVNVQITEVQKAVAAAVPPAALEERLKRIEEQSAKVPELPPDIVSAGDFPGSIRIPGTDTAIKFGGRIRTAAVFTLDSLGSDDRFLTNSIPVEDTDAAAGKGKRTTFSANTSRLNFDVRTPAGKTQMRAFIEGDFFGGTASDTRTSFRLRHAFAQYRGILVGQTWSTFSDPSANHQDLDFEGINGENVIRQAQVRYTYKVQEDLSVAGAFETPQVSLTGGQGVNVAPDLVGRAIWTFKDIGHLQGAVVFRQIRGEATLDPGDVRTTPGWGATLSGVVPFYYFGLTDRFIFQTNFGKGNARYINDLNSLGGQDAVFDPATGDLEALPAVGWYFDYEHQWKEWKATEKMKLRSSFIWSFVRVNNLDFQTPDAYHETNRYSVNVVFSPIERIDVGVEYIYGNRENKDGNSANARQFQIVAIFRF